MCFDQNTFKRRLFLLVVALPLAAVAILLLRPRTSSRLYHFDAEEIISVTVRNGNSLVCAEITGQEQIEEIVALVNKFSYQFTKAVPPAGGWSYCLDLKTPSETFHINFMPDFVRVSTEEGSIYYYGPPGYFQELADLVS